METGFFARSGSISRISVVLLSLVSALLVVAFAASGARGQDGEAPIIDRDENGVEYLSGELIVTYESDLEDAPVNALVSGVEGVVEEALPAVDSQVVSFPEVTEEVDSAVREETLEEKRLALEAEDEISSADYNYLRETVEEPNDPLYSRQWYLGKLGFPEAYSATTTSSVEDGARLAIVDTGIDLDHPDLAEKVIASRNTASPGGSADDTDGHGTHVAGIAGAATDNGRGIAGACPDCGLMIAKTDRGGFISGDALIRGINWAVNNDADVINISIAGEGAIAAEQEAVERATAAGITVIAAAGNEKTNVRHYPAAYPDVLGVSASTRQDTRAGYSNFGGWIDLAAPGEAYSTVPGAYATKNGTSMASPMVAGVAGMLAGEDLNRSQIQSRLISTATDIGPSGKDVYFGNGLVNAAAAVGGQEEPQGVDPPPRNTAPTVSAPNPRPGVTTGNRAVTVAATVRDRETDLAKSNITLFVDGRKTGFGYSRATDRLTKKTTLAPGRHTVRVVARDGQGMSKTATWSFRVSGSTNRSVSTASTNRSSISSSESITRSDRG